MDHYDQVMEAVNIALPRISDPLEVGVVLGSGLGAFESRLEGPVSLPYKSLPGWPASQVPGHAGHLSIGRIRGRTVAILAGRSHLYEGHDARIVTFGVRVLGLIGARVLVLTNASGAVRPDLEVGSLMVIDDHINLTGRNPLVGENDRFGARFPDMTQLYSPRLRAIADEAGRAASLSVSHGVYAGVVGPSYETPAEIRYLRTIGADAVGMSTVLEAIAAHQMGVEVLGLSCVSNMAAGVRPEHLDHRDVIATMQRVQHQVALLLEGFIERI